MPNHEELLQARAQYVKQLDESIAFHEKEHEEQNCPNKPCPGIWGTDH